MHYVFYVRVKYIASKCKEKKQIIYETELEWRVRMFMKLFYWKYQLGIVVKLSKVAHVILFCTL